MAEGKFNLLQFILGPIDTILQRVIPDKNKRDEMSHEIATMIETNVHTQVMAQMEINKIEAAHTSIFVAGWRPAIGWICGFALAWNFILQPIMMWVAFFFPICPITDDGSYNFSVGFCIPDLSTAPRLDTGELMTVLLGMLGLGGMRSYEKRHGVERSMLGEKK